MPAHQDSLRLGLCPWLCTGAPDGLHPADREFVLGVRRPPRLHATLRQIGEEQEAHQRKRKRDDTVDDEQPSPALVATDTVQVCVGGCL